MLSIKLLFMGIVIGLGVAIPPGPVTVEMMRRNLRYGLLRGMMVGIGASSADLTYLLLLLFGILPLLKQSRDVLHIIGVLGAILLCWFAYKTIKQKAKTDQKNGNDGDVLHCFLSGYLMAFLSPFNILFWIAIATQFATIISKAEANYLLACVGLFTGAAIWFSSLNLVVYVTRHRISKKTTHNLNIIGGIVLLGFAAYGIWHVFTAI